MDKKRILVISQYYYPEQFRVTDICEALVKRGHEVTVVAGIPNYPVGEVFAGYEESHREPEWREGVKIIRCHNRPRHRGIVNLVRNYLSFVREATRVVERLEGNFDLVYVYEVSPITMAIPAVRYCKKRKIPLYLYCLDLWPECIRGVVKGKVMSEKHPLYLLVKRLSSRLYRAADIVGVKCDPFSDYLINVCKVDKSKIRVLYEHAESSYLEISEQPTDNGCYDFMFLGNIGHAQNCDYIVKAAQQLHSDKPYKIHFVGEGSSCEELKAYVAENGLQDTVIFHGRHPVSEINRFYEWADACLLTLSGDSAVGLTLPAKLTGYMAASRPVIAAACGASRDVIADADCGICVDSNDIDGLANAMQYALDHADEFREKGVRGRQYFLRHFTLENHIHVLENQLQELVGGTYVLVSK